MYNRFYFDYVLIPCNVCIFLATCEDELNYHMYDAHDESDDSRFDTNFPCQICPKWCQTEKELTKHTKEHTDKFFLGKKKLTCKFCQKEFGSQNGLMQHNKNEHKESLNSCWKFVTGVCEFDDKSCWFKHSQCEKDLHASEFDCNKCEKSFTNQFDYMEHRKSIHENLVPFCRNESNENCTYGDKKCWFRHTQKDNNKENHE